MRAIVTTSWDDGHPLDLRVAEMLARYGLTGTFYVPFRGPNYPANGVMDGAAMRELSRDFEIGAHTMTHGDLTVMGERQVRAEMADSKRYVEDVTGEECRTFAPPGGRFGRGQLRIAAETGFRGFRTVELMNLGMPGVREGLAVMPTTLQVYPHGAGTYLRNAARRWRLGNVATYLAHARGAELPRAAEELVAAAIERGGVFHLWGHSWEIEEGGLWGVLDEVLGALYAERGRWRRATNEELCEEALRDESVAGTVADPDLS